VTAGLCIFLVALPVLWLVGFLLGSAVMVREFAKTVAPGAAGAALDLQAHTHLERLSLEILDAGLQVTRRAEGEPDASQLVAWNQLAFTRLGAQMSRIDLATGEMLELPASAFPDASAYDAFCLALQGKVWSAQRA
jgi:hypothetical protein